MKATGAVVEDGGDKACYVPAADIIRMPERRRFTGTFTTSAAEGF
nr:zincin-like metallopeptidase domain-containing protein [Pseudorhizobium marinum]